MKKKTWNILLLTLLLLVVVWFALPPYLSKALIYQQVGIEDYSIFENRTIQAGTPLPWSLHKAYNQSVPSAQDSAYFYEYGTVAFLVAVHDSILFEEYWDGYSDTSLSNSFSMAKSIISLMIGCLLDEGKIKSLDQPVTDFITGFEDPQVKKITIKDLLTMSSGLDWDEAYSSAFSKTTQAYYGNDLHKLVTSLKVATPAGKVFNYQSCDTQLLGLIIEKASGKHIAEYASEKLWKPLGAEHDALWSLDQENGTEKAYCCFNSNARDFARIGQMILDSGQFNHRSIVSKSYLEQATSPAQWLKDSDGNPCTYYGYQFWLLNHHQKKAIYARGILGQYIFVIPDLQMVVVRLGNKRSDKQVNHIPEDVFRYLDAAIDIAGASVR